MEIPKVRITRNCGHPWDGRPGFDLMFLNASTNEEWILMQKRAFAKFWQMWIGGIDDATNLPGGFFYKPCGITAPWSDHPDNPHPGRQAHA